MSYFLTKEKKAELEKELKKLLNDGRREIAERLDDAKALGDLKENAEYHQARDDQGKMEARIQEIEAILKDAEIIQKNNNGTIELGSKVDLKADGVKKSYELVGRQDSDIFSGKITVDSPLGKVLIGKEKGDKFEFITPTQKKVKYEILKVY